MNFSESLERDLNSVFNNTAEFAKQFSVFYDEVSYENVPVVLTGTAKDGQKTSSRHDEGIYVNEVQAYIRTKDIEKEIRKNHNIQIGDIEYSIKEVCEEMGQTVLTLEVLDE